MSIPLFPYTDELTVCNKKGSKRGTSIRLTRVQDIRKLSIQRVRERGISNLRANRKRINLWLSYAIRLSIRGTFLLNRQPVTYLVKFNLIANLKVCKRCSNIIKLEFQLRIAAKRISRFYHRCRGNVLMFYLTCFPKESWKFTAQECGDWASIEATPKPIISNKNSRKRIPRRKFSTFPLTSPSTCSTFSVFRVWSACDESDTTRTDG